MQTATGIITVVQEQRFRLLTPTGQGLLLTLARNASLTSSDLWRLHTAHIQVVVTYQGEPNLESGVAYGVRPSVLPGGIGHDQ
jgi:hypothetical protein